MTARVPLHYVQPSSRTKRLIKGIAVHKIADVTLLIRAIQTKLLRHGAEPAWLPPVDDMLHDMSAATLS